MGNWRKFQGETHYALDHQGRRPGYRKPPLENRKAYVPSWEKKFCTSIGSVSWRKLLETKKYMYLHENVVQWDDSAGREAFHNAKSMFWAKINGLKCNISLPDPDIYIDDVDWDSCVDPELLSDLEKEPKASTEGGSQEDEAVILSDSLQLNQPFSCTGWGDAEADPQMYDGGNHWEDDCIQANVIRKEYEWGNCWDGWNQWEDHASNKQQQRMEDRVDWSWGTWQGNQKKGETLGWYVPNQKPSNIPGDEYHRSGRLRNGRGRKTVNFGY